MAIKNGLTPKQEKFCQCIVSGMSGKDSYIAAYDCNNERVARNEAPKLLQRDDVSKRIQEMSIPLQNHAVNTAISEREKKRTIIWSRIEECINNGDDTAIARYMDILNKMDAEYINVNHNIEDSSTDLNNIDTTTLLKLVK